MGRRSYSGEKRRKELARKAKREAKQQRRMERKRGDTEPQGEEARPPQPPIPPGPGESP